MKKQNVAVGQRRSSVTTFLLVLFSSMCVNSRLRSPLEISYGAVAVQAKRKSLSLRAIRRKCQQFQPLIPIKHPSDFPLDYVGFCRFDRSTLLPMNRPIVSPTLMGV